MDKPYKIFVADTCYWDFRDTPEYKGIINDNFHMKYIPKDSKNYEKEKKTIETTANSFFNTFMWIYLKYINDPTMRNMCYQDFMMTKRGWITKMKIDSRKYTDLLNYCFNLFNERDPGTFILIPYNKKIRYTFKSKKKTKKESKDGITLGIECENQDCIH